MWRGAVGTGMLATCLLLGVVGHAEGEGIVVVGYLKGNAWRAMSEAAQQAYSVGVVDGLLLGSALEGQISGLAWISRCLGDGMLSNQLHAILKSEVEARPGEWHRTNVALMMLEGLSKACPNAPQKGR